MVSRDSCPLDRDHGIRARSYPDRTRAAIGLAIVQLTRMSLLEPAVMVLIAGVLAIPLGTVSGWIPANVVNQRAFGGSTDFHINFDVPAKGVAIAVLVALIVGARTMLSLNAQSPAAGLRYA